MPSPFLSQSNLYQPLSLEREGRGFTFVLELKAQGVQFIGVVALQVLVPLSPPDFMIELGLTSSRHLQWLGKESLIERLPRKSLILESRLDIVIGMVVKRTRRHLVSIPLISTGCNLGYRACLMALAKSWL